MRLKRNLLAGLSALGLIAMGCGIVLPEADDSEASSEEQIFNEDGEEVVKFSGTLALQGSQDLALAEDEVKVTDLVAYCLSFEAEPRARKSDFEDAGDGKAKFELELLKGVGYGCFVNNKDGQTLATILRSTKDAGFGGGEGTDSSLALDASVTDLELTLNLETGEVIIPAEALEGKISAVIDELKKRDNSAFLDKLHAKDFKMVCVTPRKDADPKQVKACEEFVKESPHVYLRILKAKQGEDNVYGLGVWHSSEAFGNCGGFDMNKEQAEGIAKEGFEWTQNDIGEYTFGEACPLRDEKDAHEDMNLQDKMEAYYALEKLSPKGFGSFGMESGDEYDDGQGCVHYHHLSLVFTEIPDSEEFAGMFRIADGKHGESCDRHYSDAPGPEPTNSDSKDVQLADSNETQTSTNTDTSTYTDTEYDKKEGPSRDENFRASFAVKFVPIKK